MRFILFLVIFPLLTFAQKIESEKIDTISINTSRCLTYALKINNFSASDPAMVFVTTIQNFDTLKQLIPAYYFARKQEYNEYYILGVPDMTHTTVIDRALILFINQIDSARVSRNRSTFRRIYTFDKNNGNLIYQNEFRELLHLDNVFYVKSVNDICKYMTCSDKRSVED